MLNLNIINQRTNPEPFTYDEDRVILYALGIGSGVEELEFIYEKNLKVIPTFAVIVAFPSLEKVMSNANINVQAALGVEHKLILHHQIPTNGTIFTTGIVSNIYDKGNKGALIQMQAETKDEKGNILFENHVIVVDRSAGNFGGEKGPKSAVDNPPDGRSPDIHVEYKIWPNQHALYRLSGDKNPLHIDPEFAKRGGFDQPILHGHCTLGFAGRAILNSVCGGNPSRLKSLSVRFTGVVFPGDSLTIEGWDIGKEKYVFQAVAQDGRIVLGNALAEVS